MCVRGLTNHSASRMPKIYSGVSWQIVLLSPFDKCFCVIHWNSLFVGFCQLDTVDIPTVAEGIEIAQCVGHGAGGSQRIASRIVGVAGGGVWRRYSAPYPTAKFQPILGYERNLAESDQSPIAYKPVLIEYLGQVSAPKRPKKQETLRRLP